MRADARNPRQFYTVAHVGNDPVSISATSSRVWVVNQQHTGAGAASSPQVEEFGASGHLLHSYRIPGAVAVQAYDDVGVVESVMRSGEGDLVELSAGSLRQIAPVPHPAPVQPGAAGLVFDGVGRIGIGVIASSSRLAVMVVDLRTGTATRSPSVRMQGLVSIAHARTGFILGAANVAAGGICRFGATVKQFPKGPKEPTGLEATSAMLWVASSPDLDQNIGIQRGRLGTDALSPRLSIPSVGGGGFLASSAGRVWIVTGEVLYRLR
jgi:hypothetical protein